LIIRSLLVLAGLSALANCTSQAVASQPVREVASAADEIAYREGVFAKIKSLIVASDFQALTALEETYRTSRSRTTSGYWNLGLFHTGVDSFLGEGLTAEKGCTALNADFVTRWKAAFPNSPAPIIAEAEMLKNQGWCYRGSGFADKVAPEAWPKFRERLQSAYELLETNKKIASVNPEYYAVQASLYRGLSAPEDKFRDMMDEATKREPAYFRTYFTAVWYHMPQWGGSWGEVDRFLRYAAKKSEKTEGSGAYIRILWNLEACNCDIIKEVADWPTLQASMRDVYQRYPNGRNREYFMKLSCKMDNPQAAFEFAQKGFPEKSKDELNSMTLQACSEAMVEQQAASR
jgi:hypothetical protein